MKKRIMFPVIAAILFIGISSILYFTFFYPTEVKDKLMDEAFLWGFYIHVEPTPDPVKPALENLIARYKNGQINAIDISTITTFPWDRLHIIGALIGPLDMNDVVGRSWRMVDSCIYAVNTASDPSDGDDVLIFSEKGKVVHCSIFERRHLDVKFYLHLSERETGIAQQEALFILDGGQLITIPRK